MQENGDDRLKKFLEATSDDVASALASIMDLGKSIERYAVDAGEDPTSLFTLVISHMAHAMELSDSDIKVISEKVLSANAKKNSMTSVAFSTGVYCVLFLCQKHIQLRQGEITLEPEHPLPPSTGKPN